MVEAWLESPTATSPGNGADPARGDPPRRLPLLGGGSVIAIGSPCSFVACDGPKLFEMVRVSVERAAGLLPTQVQGD
ncbi:hypothetical protein GCM10009661_29830 [Catellatospora chokoriensis]